MATGTILPEDEDVLSVVREQAGYLFQLGESNLKAVMQLMKDNPQGFSTSRVRRVSGLRTQEADNAHKFLIYVVHQSFAHEKDPDVIKKDLTKLGGKPEQVKIITDIIGTLPQMNRNILDVLFTEYARSPEEEVNEGTVASFRGEVLLRTFSGDGGKEMIYPVAHVYIGLNQSSGEQIKLELTMNFDEYGKFVSLLEESYDNLLEDAKKTKKSLGTDALVALER